MKVFRNSDFSLCLAGALNSVLWKRQGLFLLVGGQGLDLAIAYVECVLVSLLEFGGCWSASALVSL